MTVRILTGDCRHTLPTLDAGSVQCCVTSPPYFGLRDYGVDGQIGLESTVEAYVAEMVSVFREVRRVLREDGVLWLNLGDSYASTAPGTRNAPMTKGSKTDSEQWANMRPDLRNEGIKPKDMIGIPWRVAFALQADGWWLRSDCIWAKPNPMPESVRDRPTKSHEYVFLLSKSQTYFWDADAVKEDAKPESAKRYAAGYKAFGTGQFEGSPTDKRTTKTIQAEELAHLTGRNLRTVWTIATRPYKDAHFATFPPDLAEICIKSGSRPGDTVLDPFGGAGTTGLVADRLGRDAVLIELNPDYADMARRRISADAPLFSGVA